MTKSLPFCVEMPPRTPASEGRTRLWPPGTVLHVAFLDGTRAQQDAVARAAEEWTAYANLRFVFGDKVGAEIRVTFATAGIWSYVGTDALAVPPDQPTVGLGGLNQHNLHGAALHVFGHVLGFVHEHQNPASGLPWNKEKLYAYLAGAYGWAAQQVNDFILARYGVSTVGQPFFDPKSIMLMPVPPELTHGSFAIGWNTALTASDKSYAAQCYPAATALESLGIPKGLVEEKIRLDVATPQTAVLDEPFDLAVAVLRPDAPPLAIDDLPAVSSEEGTVYRPGPEEVIRYRIEVTGANCDVKPAFYTILLRPGKNSKPSYFQVTPHKPGKRTLVVNAYQEDDILAAQTRVRIEVQVPVRTEPAPLSPNHEAPLVDIVLSPAEIRQFKEALLSAFQREELEQVVLFGLQVQLDRIVARSNYDKEVADLAIWVNEHNKVAALLKEARRVNGDNVTLREFDAYIQAKQS